MDAFIIYDKNVNEKSIQKKSLKADSHFPKICSSKALKNIDLQLIGPIKSLAYEMQNHFA